MQRSPLCSKVVGIILTGKPMFTSDFVQHVCWVFEGYLIKKHGSAFLLSYSVQGHQTFFISS